MKNRPNVLVLKGSDKGGLCFRLESGQGSFSCSETTLKGFFIKLKMPKVSFLSGTK